MAKVNSATGSLVAGDELREACTGPAGAAQARPPAGLEADSAAGGHPAVAGGNAAADHRKRILYVENGVGHGGALICLLHLARNLDRSAYVCRIVTGRDEPDYQRIGQEFDWRPIRDRRFDAPLLRRRIDRSAAVAKIPGLRRILGQVLARADDLVNFLPFFLGLLREVRAFRPDLIHANNEPLCNRAALLLGRLFGIPTVSHVRGPQEQLWMVRQVVRVPDHFVSVSHWIDRELESFGIPAAKRTVIPDGIEMGGMADPSAAAAVRAGLGLEPTDFAVGLVGLLMPWKGHGVFLDAALRLRGRIPGLKMLIIGDTPDEYRDYGAEMRRRVAEEELADTVVFTGYIRDILPVYQALDVVVSASTLPEPLGTMVIEAMASGRPLVAPNYGGGAEMNTDGVTALLFEPGDAGALSEAIWRLYAAPELRASLGAAARERALSRFAIASHVAAVQDVYRHLLGN